MNANEIKALIVANYNQTARRANEVCNRTCVNDPERNESLVNFAKASALITRLHLEKLVGMTYFNVWD